MGAEGYVDNVACPSHLETGLEAWENKQRAKTAGTPF